MKHELEEVKWGVIPLYCYRGVLVEKIIGGYKVLNQTVIKTSEVDNVINEAEEYLRNSMVIE